MKKVKHIRSYQFAKALQVYIHKFIKTGEEKYRAIIIKHCTWYDEETIDSWKDLCDNMKGV